MTTPIVFLDFDGVLNSSRTTQRWPEGSVTTGVDPLHVGRLSRLLEVSGAEVVISSAWRKIYSLGDLKRVLLYQGEMPSELRRRILGVTQLDGRIRGEQIEAWLSLHGRRPYAILDDCDDMLPEQLDRLVLVDDGLTEEDIIRAWEVLER